MTEQEKKEFVRENDARLRREGKLPREKVKLGVMTIMIMTLVLKMMTLVLTQKPPRPRSGGAR
jgi:hypothetical protein